MKTTIELLDNNTKKKIVENRKLLHIRQIQTSKNGYSLVLTVLGNGLSTPTKIIFIILCLLFKSKISNQISNKMLQ